jgi:predicted anti-sigma-YlaC factor YlaD
MDWVLRPWVATCDQTRERLSEQLEGALRGREAKRVLRHLARCPNCRKALRSLARTVDGLRSLGRSDELLPRAETSIAGVVTERVRREATPS